MAKYRLLTDPVEAIQFLEIIDGVPVFNEPTPEWVAEGLAKGKNKQGSIWLIPPHIAVGGHHGHQSSPGPGDWIIRQPDGSLTICYGKAFHLSYAPVDVPMAKMENAPS